MKKRLISIILIIMLLLSLASCNTSKNDNATIQLWNYNYSDAWGYSEAVENVILKIKLYCDANNIPLEIVKYNQDTLSYEDYILKRNAAMASGNMITIDDARRLKDIAKYHADYSKVENYDKLLDMYKDKFCIPLGVGYQNFGISNEILDEYDINVDKPVILYNDYLEIKQELKEKGAKFKLSTVEWYEIIEYYLLKNGLVNLDEKSNLIENTEELKKVIKKTVIEVYEDFKLYNGYYEGLALISDKDKKVYNQDRMIVDLNSGIRLYDGNQESKMLSEYAGYSEMNDDILDYTFVINNTVFLSPCVYMHKKITNDKIYDVFNELINDSYYRSLSRLHIYSTVHNTETVRKYLELDDNWEYNGLLKNSSLEKHKKQLSITNESYRKLIKDEKESEIILGYYFGNSAQSISISGYVDELAKYIITGKLDYNDKNVDDELNRKIDECINNMKVHYN